MSKYILVGQIDEHISKITSLIKMTDKKAVILSIRADRDLFGFIAKENPDFIFLNFDQPDHHCLNICKTLQAKYAGKFCLILTATPEAVQNAQEEILGSGADAFYTFPINELTFRLQLQSWLSFNKTNKSKSLGLKIQIAKKYEANGIASLTEREIKYSAVIENSTDGILIINREGLIIEANKSIERITGFREDEYTNIPFWDFQYKLERTTEQSLENYDYLKGYLTQILNEHDSKSFGKLTERQIKRADGQTRFIETTFYPIRTNGNFYLTSLVRDITQRKLFEEAIKNSESKYHGIFDANKDGISIFLINPDDTVSNFIEANKAAFEMIGYSNEEFLSMNIFDINFAGTQDSALKIISRLKSKKFLNMETTIRHRNGSLLSVDIHIVTIKYNNQVALMNIVRDITARKKVELDLKESEERFKMLFEKAPIGYQSLNENGFIVDVNETWLELMGYKKDEVLGCWFGDFMTPESLVFYRQKFPEFKKTGQVQTELELYRKNGEIIRIQLKGSVRQTAIGSFKQMYCLLSDITELHKASKAIADERILLRTLIDNIPDMIYVKDTSGRKLISNKADLALLGLNDEKEVIGKTDLELFNEEIATNTLRDDQTVMSTAKPIFNKPETFTGLDGLKRTISTTKIPLTSESGEIIGLVSVGRDITREKETGQKIVQLSKAIEQSRTSVLITDIEGNIEYMNQRVIDITGYSFEQIKGKNPRIFQSGYTSQEEYAKLWETIRSGGEYRGEIQNRKRNGEIYWESVVISPIRNEEGEIVNYLAIKEDITNRKKSDLEILKLSVGIEQSPASVVITDTRGTIEYVNKKFVDTAGYSPNELIGKVLRILKPGHVDDETYIEIWNCLFAGNEWRGEHQNRNKKREKYWESVLISPIKNDEGKVTNYIVLSEDISERKKMEGDLIKAKEKAEESDRLKSAFLANMSHEIRTPLNSILGFSDLLSDQNLDVPSRLEYTQLINSSGGNLLSIINDVLDISKIEAGQVTLSEKEFSANDLVSEIRKEYFHKATGKNLEFRLRLPVTEPEIKLISDESRIKQVLINFVGNALKFTESGYIEIGLEKTDGKVQFHVKDTGIGISKEFHEKIFDRFRQVEGANTRKYSGNGLGLAITKNLAVLLGGIIWMDSEPGKGSTFYFALPAKD